MRRSQMFAASVFGALALLGGAAGAQSGPATYRADMTGEEEVPGPGAAGGRGTAELIVDDAAGQLCYTLRYEGMSPPSAGHVHQGAKGTAGPVAVNLDVAKNGTEGCVPVDAMVSHALAADPGGHYVNLHNPDYPNGAIRGQLAAG